MDLFPLTRSEIPDFDLLTYCSHGGLPMIYSSDEPWLDLRDYAHLYLKEEVMAEGIVRKVDHYAKFLDVIGRGSGEELNYQQISNDSGVAPRTVAHFVEILKDTLLAYELEPYRQTKSRKAVAKSKIYLFDVGVANYFAGRKSLLTRSPEFGRSFEHFLIQEIRAYLGYHQQDLPMTYWRTLGGAFEVDCLIGNEAAIEIKAAESFQEQHLRGLRALKEEKQFKNYYLVSRDPVPRVVSGIHVIPYGDFLDRLWAHDIC